MICFGLFFPWRKIGKEKKSICAFFYAVVKLKQEDYVRDSKKMGYIKKTHIYRKSKLEGVKIHVQTEEI